MLNVGQKSLVNAQSLNGVRSDVWFQYPRPDPNARMRLFCFPHAGSGASAYRDWSRIVSSKIEICAVQLPGRENRFIEPSFEHVDALLDELFMPMLSQLTKPFAFFGHSMGALIAFELSRRLQEQQSMLPAYLLVSGRGAPQTPDPGPVLHALPDAEFVEELRRFEGIADEIVRDAELMALLLPRLRADSKLCETYTYRESTPLACPIIAYGGTADERVDRVRLDAWQQQTSARFVSRMFGGGHFFIQSEAAKRAVAADLASIVEVVA